MQANVPSHIQPHAQATVCDTQAVTRHRNPHPIANATSGAIRRFTNTATGLTTWNRDATIGAVTIHTAKPAMKRLVISLPNRRKRRSMGLRLRSMSRAIGSSACVCQLSKSATVISTAVARNESCAPV